MKREQLLRQLDENVDRLEEEVAFARKEVQRIQAEEKQRIPKWARCPTSQAHYITAGKWYRVIHQLGDLWEYIDNDRDHIHFANPPETDQHSGSVWELCYDDTPPAPHVEKKVERPRLLNLDEKTRVGDMRVLPNGHTIVIMGLAGLFVNELDPVKQFGTVVIRWPKEQK